MISKIRNLLAQGGASAVAGAVLRRVLRSRAPAFDATSEHFVGLRGVEIGGPSALFARGGLFPVYPLLAGLDNVNFSSSTVWEGDAGQGAPFVFDAHKAPGQQFLSEASSLGGITDASYDVLFASHVIEHLANPLAAMAEWARVVRPGGLVVLVVPHRDGTFDHRRPVTPLAHLEDDLRAGTAEDDLTHLAEVLALHDRQRDPGAGTAEAFTARSQQNFQYRCLHHHVFDTRAVARLAARAGWEILALSPVRPYHIFLVARVSPGGHVGNGGFLDDASVRLSKSPFPSDHAPV